MGTIYNLIGGVTHNSAQITTRLEPILPELGSRLRIMRVHYHPSVGYNVYMDGKLVATDTSRTGNFSYIDNLVVGADADDVAYLKGLVPEVYFIKNTAQNSDIETNNINIERWLAEKWLPFGTILDDGYVVGTNPLLIKPPLVANRADFFHIDETSFTLSGNTVTKVTDKVGWQGTFKEGLPTSGSIAGELVPVKAGRQAIKFDGETNYMFSGMRQSGDPDYITMFMVYKLDDWNYTGDDQTILGNLSNANEYNNALRIKKYASDDFLSTRFNFNGYAYADISKADAFTETGDSTPTELSLVKLRYSKSPTFADYIDTPEIQSYSDSSFTKHTLNGLTPDSKYYVKTFVDGIEDDYEMSFNTLPIAGSPKSFNFVAGSCNYTGSNATTFEEIRNEKPLFWSHLGDWHYEDIGINNIQLFRNAFALSASTENMRNLNREVPLAYMWDDHDYGMNNSDKDSPSKVASTAFYTEQIPHYPFLNNPDADPLTDTIGQSWVVGRVQFIMTDCRSQRNDFRTDDYDPTKTILGDVQKEWFKSKLLEAHKNPNIGLICWLNPISWTGEDLNGYSWSYGSSGESWIAYKAERTEIYNFIRANNISNLFIINGDTHQVAIDDGRNAVFDTMYPTTLNWRDIEEKYLTPVIEASPFDRDVDRGGGQFQINDIGDSGSVTPLSERTYSLFKIEDDGSEWIKVRVEQYCLPDGLTYYTEKTLVNSFEFVRQVNGRPKTKPTVNNKKALFLEGDFTIPSGEATVSKGITFTTPATFESNWKAPVSGYIDNSLGWSNREVRVYRRSDADYLVGTFPVNATDGTFTTGVTLGTSTLVFKVYNTTNNTMLKEFVNDGNYGMIYSDLEARLFVVTDAEYLISSASISTNKRFKFPVSDDDSQWVVKLYRKSTGTYLAETKIKGLLPRSYEFEPDDPVLITPFARKGYLYDAGLSLISFTGLKDWENMNRILKGLKSAQLPNGSFPFSANHINPSGADAYLRTGAIAWVAYSLGYCLEYGRFDIDNKIEAETMLKSVLDYILTLWNPTHKLVRGGSGRYYMDGGVELFDPNYQIGWYSTEHNIDTYFALKQGIRVLRGTSNYKDYYEDIKIGIMSNLVAPDSSRLYQGLNADGSPDLADALDCNSWGAICMISMGNYDLAETLMARCEAYYKVTDAVRGITGYKPYSPDWGYPSAQDVIWFEGSFGVALGYFRVGRYDKWNQIMRDLYSYMEDDGAFRYSTERDGTYEITDAKSVASTTWSIVAGELRFNVWL